MRRGLLIGGVVVALVMGWVVLRPDSTDYEVHGRTDDAHTSSDSCIDLPGVDAERSSFMYVSDLPIVPGDPNGGVTIRVSGKDEADAVAECLADQGAVDVTVNEATESGPPSSFERTGP